MLFKEASSKMKEITKESLEALCKTFLSGQIALESSKAASSQLDADYHSTRRAIQESSSALRNAINIREAELLKQADAKRIELSKKLDQNSAGLEPATMQAQSVITEAKKEIKSKENGSHISLLKSYSELNSKINSAHDTLKKVLEIPSSQHPLPQFKHGGLMTYVPTREGRQILASLRAFGTVSVNNDFKSGKRSPDESFDNINLFISDEHSLSPPQQKRHAGDKFIDKLNDNGTDEQEKDVDNDLDYSFILSPAIKKSQVNNNNNNNNVIDIDDIDDIPPNSLPLFTQRPQQQQQQQSQSQQSQQPQQSLFGYDQFKLGNMLQQPPQKQPKY